MDKDWIALRCAGNKTKQLADCLKESGLSAWTPIVVRNVRVPRKSVRRAVEIPLMTTFVFLLVADLIEAEELKLRMKCPQFSAMKFLGIPAVFSANQLDHLRKMTEPDLPAAEKPKLKFPADGVRVQVKVGAFDGMYGIVIGRTKHESIVQFENSKLEVKIPPFLFVVSER